MKMPGNRYKHLIPDWCCEIIWRWNMKTAGDVGAASPLLRAGEGQGDGI